MRGKGFQKAKQEETLLLSSAASEAALQAVVLEPSLARGQLLSSPIPSLSLL